MEGLFFGILRYVNNPLHVILHCLVCILSFNVNNGDTAKSRLVLLWILKMS